MGNVLGETFGANILGKTSGHVLHGLSVESPKAKRLIYLFAFKQSTVGYK